MEMRTKTNFTRAVEAAGQVLNDAGHVEEQWMLLGFADAIKGRIDRESETDPLYGADYRRGYFAGLNALED